MGQDLTEALAEQARLRLAFAALPSNVFVAFRGTVQQFRDVVETYDPESTAVEEIRSALDTLIGHFPDTVLRFDGLRFIPRYKPTAAWQAQRWKAIRLGTDGYVTAKLPNHDGLPKTRCSLAYDLADFSQAAQRICGIAEDALPLLLAFDGWPYWERRIRASRDALGDRSLKPVVDPFARLAIRGRSIRFVSWRTSSWTHASEDAEDVRGASTVCGRKLAYHKHTHQQWTCYACGDCRNILDGRPIERLFPAIRLVVREDGDNPRPAP